MQLFVPRILLSSALRSRLGSHCNLRSLSAGRFFSSAHVDSNVPGNPSYHFKVVKPGTPPVAGWGSRDTILEAEGVGKGTLCVHAGSAPDPAHHAVMVPIYMSSTFAFNDVCTTAGYDYTRSGNPTRAALEKAITMLEGGSGAAATSTGMSAVLLALNLLPRGSHIICTIDCYGGTFRTMQHAVATYGLRVTFVDLRDKAAFEKAFIKGETKMVWVETPSNPLLRVTDVAPIARAAKAGGALVVVDNTFLSPALFKPFEHGADLVIYSTTKYLNGHSDIVGGAVVARAGDAALAQRIASLNNLMGTSQAPHDAFLVLRGLKTLHLRMRAHQENARAVAAYLTAHPKVRIVHYPGIGGMLSFELHSREQKSVNAILRGLKLFTLAESLGGVESLVAHPASMTHASMTPEARAAAGISDSLIRLSIGIEDVKDLIADLTETLGSI